MLSDQPYLKRCNLAECEAICCFNGVYLNSDDIERLSQALDLYPEHFAQLPNDCIIDGAFKGRAPASKR